MLIAICVAAICLQLPYMILYMVNDRRLSWWPHGEGSALFAWIYAGKEISEALSIANYSVNFFLYCVSGSAFRHHVRKITLCICGASRRSLLDASLATSCTSASRHSTSPIRLQARQQNAVHDDNNDIVRLAD